MIIVLYGSEKDNKIIEEIYSTLERDYNCFYSGDGVLKGSNESELILKDMNGKIKIESKVDLIIIKEKANVSSLKQIDKDIPLLFWSSKKRQKDNISKLGLKAISCGLSQKDTLTFSSVGEYKAVVSLQRDLFNHFPMEIPVQHKKGISKYSILIMAAIALLIEKEDEIKLKLKP